MLLLPLVIQLSEYKRRCCRVPFAMYSVDIAATTEPVMPAILRPCADRPKGFDVADWIDTGVQLVVTMIVISGRIDNEGLCWLMTLHTLLSGATTYLTIGAEVSNPTDFGWRPRTGVVLVRVEVGRVKRCPKPILLATDYPSVETPYELSQARVRTWQPLDGLRTRSAPLADQLPETGEPPQCTPRLKYNEDEMTCSPVVLYPSEA